MHTKTNFVIDFETLATRPNAVVRCLSVIPFTLGQEETIDQLLSRQLTVWFDPLAQINDGRALDDDTIEFWNGKLNSSSTQAERENAEFILGQHPEDVHPKEALEIISAYIHDVAPQGLIYSRGAGFDFPILESLCDMYGVALPFSTWKAACSKSILRFSCGDDKDIEASLVGGLKSNHSSAYDCAVEALKLQVLYNTLNSDG